VGPEESTKHSRSFIKNKRLKKENVQEQEQKKKNSVVLVRKRTIPSERPQPAGEVSANFS
jgi:hypothetical protein